jgi:hypothetical protein
MAADEFTQGQLEAQVKKRSRSDETEEPARKVMEPEPPAVALRIILEQQEHQDHVSATDQQMARFALAMLRPREDERIQTTERGAERSTALDNAAPDQNEALHDTLLPDTTRCNPAAADQNAAHVSKEQADEALAAAGSSEMADTSSGYQRRRSPQPNLQAELQAERCETCAKLRAQIASATHAHERESAKVATLQTELDAHWSHWSQVAELDKKLHLKETELRRQASLQAGIAQQLQCELEAERDRCAKLTEEKAALQAQARQCDAKLGALQMQVETLTAQKASEQKEVEPCEQALDRRGHVQVATLCTQACQERLDDFLKTYELSEYCEALRTAGYVFVDDLRDADADDYAEGTPLALVLDTLKKPERKRLVRLGIINR